MEKNYAILLMLLLPVLGGVIGFFLGKKNRAAGDGGMSLIAIAELAMQGYFAFWMIRNHTVMKLALGESSGFGVSFTIDGARLVFCMISTVVFGIVSQFMETSVKEETGNSRFCLLYMCVYSLVLGAFVSNSLFHFSIFLALAALSAYPMIVYRQEGQALKNARIYMGFSLASIVVMQAGLLSVYVNLGRIDYSGMYDAITLNGSNKGVAAGGLLIAVGFAIFCGIFPFQLQVTRGCAYGPMEGTVLLTSMVSKLGVFGMMLLASNLFIKNLFFGRILMFAGLFTAIWGILISFTVTDVRKILMGIHVAANGFNTLAISFMVLFGDSNGYAVRGSLYMLITSAISLSALYMVALELVRETKTYEIKGLIESGKGHKLLAIAGFAACASLGGIPGTIGFSGYSLLFRAIYTDLGWKWLIVFFIIMWAFFMTSVARIFMKLFVSKKEEALRILTKEEVSSVVEPAEGKKRGNTYLIGEAMLLLACTAQIVIGIFPGQTVDKMAEPVVEFFKGGAVAGTVSYYTPEVLVGFGITVLLSILFYVNLVHGVLLRTIRNRKNRKLQESMSERM